MELALPAFDYRYLYTGLLSASDSTILIKKQGMLKLRPEIPIHPMGTHAIRLELDAIRKLLGNIQRGSSEYPVIFVFNTDYGKLSFRPPINIAFLGGVSLIGEPNQQESQNRKSQQRIRYLIGYSRVKDKQNNRWNYSTICKVKGKKVSGIPCKLYLTLVVDYDISKVLGEKKGKISVKVQIGKDKELVADDVILYSTTYTNVNVYERTFTELSETSSPYESQCLKTNVGSNADISLCPADAEVIHLGSQLVVRGEVSDVTRGRSRYTYFVFPTVIAYPAKLPQDPYNDTALPKDYLFNTSLLKLSIKGFNWEKALDLIDWLWREHRDAVFKLFLNVNVMKSLWRIFRNKVGGTTPPLVEQTVTTLLYNNYLVYYSLNTNKFVDLYYKIRKDHSNIAGLVAEIFNKLYNINVSVTTNEENAVKKVLAVYALMFGLHGISHLLMKALAASTGLSNYGELIRVKIEESGLQDDVLNVLNVNKDKGAKSTNSNEIYHENIFYVSAGDKFELEVKVFSRDKYSFHHFKGVLEDDYGSLDVRKLMKTINQLLSVDNGDRCDFNWRMERKHLYFGRFKFLVDKLREADEELGKWLNDHYRPTRSLFRVLYSHRLVTDITDAVVNKGSNATKQERDDFKKKLERHVQFMWPYHLEQCVDGCYNCVLVSRTVRSSTCDMTPLMQELKTSKWAALGLLKYAGLFNAEWVGWPSQSNAAGVS